MKRTKRKEEKMAFHGGLSAAPLRSHHGHVNLSMRPPRIPRSSLRRRRRSILLVFGAMIAVRVDVHQDVTKSLHGLLLDTVAVTLIDTPLVASGKVTQESQENGLHPRHNATTVTWRNRVHTSGVNHDRDPHLVLHQQTRVTKRTTSCRSS